jgi:hypothetical protein
MAEPQYSNWPVDSTTMRARAESDRRCGLDRRDLSTTEQEMLRCCRLAGMQFHGVQKTYGLVPGGDMLLFGKSRYSTTWAIPIAEVTPLRLLEHASQYESRRQQQPTPGRGFRMIFKPTTNPAVRAAQSA